MHDIKPVLREFIHASCGTPMPHPDAVRCAYARLMVEHFKGNLSKACRAMGLHRRTLQRMLKKNPDRRIGRPECMCKTEGATHETTTMGA
jgi:transcriptional regulator with AAA-type ATPase domain